MTELEEHVQRTMALHLEVDPVHVRPDARLGEDLCVDSLTAIELTMVLEDEFDIAVPEEVMVDMCTFGDVVAVVSERVTPPA